MTKVVQSSLIVIATVLCIDACKPDISALKSGSGTASDGGSSGSGSGGRGSSSGAAGTAEPGSGGVCEGACAGTAGATLVNPSGGIAGLAGSTSIGASGGIFGNAGSGAGKGGSAGSGAGKGGSAGTSVTAGSGGAAATGGVPGTSGAAGTTTTCEIPPLVFGAPPILAYDFNSTSGTVAVDSSGNSKNGTLLGTPVWNATGRLGGAITFNAANQYVELPQDVLAGLNAVTIAAWVRLSANPAASTLFDFGSNSTNHFYLRTNGGTGVSYGVQVNGGSVQETATSYSLPVGIWKHVALAVGDGTSSLYIDGIKVISRPITFAPSALGSTAGNWIGHTHSSTTNLYGSVDDFRVYGRSLEPREVEAIAPPGTDYVHFNFDEPCGNKAHDRSDKSLVATLPMGGTWTSGSIGGALTLNGVDQYLQLPANSVQSCSDLTVAMWVQRSVPANWERLFSFGQSAKTSMTLATWTSFKVMQFSAKLNGGDARGSADEQQFAASSTALSPQSGLWGHVAVVLQAGTGRLYFNGQEVGTGTVSIKPSDMGSTAINVIGQPLYVGEPYLTANVDDLRISCRAFPPGEIKILALAGQ